MLKAAFAVIAIVIGSPAPAVAQDADYEYQGAIVHRRMFTLPQCVGNDPQQLGWVHNGPPCGRTDVAWIDNDWHIHFIGPIPPQRKQGIIGRLEYSGFNVIP